jgi:SAM-dependent methyltransferase
MQKRHSNRQQYFLEQETTTRKHVIPFIGKFKEITPELRVLEIGCGEGGNLKPFLDCDCRVTGIDLSEHKIGLARSFFADHPQNERLQLICDDIYRMDPPEDPFDVVIMRDVIEHIHDQERFMAYVKPFMHGSTLFFLAFPPWQNPFGGHQQICRNKIAGHLPWIHLFPVPVYRGILRAGGESDATVENLLEVKETGISIERFERIIKNQSYRIVAKKYFLINPNYEVKFGLRPMEQAGWFAAIPGIRNLLTTSAYYILSPGKEN